MTGPSSYKKRIYRAAVSQRLRNTVLSSGLVTYSNHIAGSNNGTSTDPVNSCVTGGGLDIVVAPSHKYGGNFTTLHRELLTFSWEVSNVLLRHGETSNVVGI